METGADMNKGQKENEDIRQVLDLGGRFPRRKWYFIIILICLPVAAALVLKFWPAGGSQSGVSYKTEKAVRGELTVTVSATGTLKPVNQVDVGTEISGTLKTVEVDFNDPVKQDQVLARLDTTKLEAQKLQNEAALAVAEAELQSARADLVEAKTSLDRLWRVYKLSEGKMPSRQDLDTAQAKHKKALAQVEVGKANVAKAQAAKEATESDLSKAIIRAPIDGIVLDRQVEVGQTVAASLQTPVLFTLAEDLTRMYLYVSVDEADVGQVREGQSATFSVDAYPDRQFPAHITQVRYTPQTESGVVTYICLLSVDNFDLLLRPGMTATADILVRKTQDALLVPNAALRFTPADQAAPSEEAPRQSFLSRLMPGPRRRPQGKRAQNQSKSRPTTQVWVLNEGRPFAIPVTTGATDGVVTEIVAGEVKPGQELLVETVQAKK
ncbi:MAG: efflux RND transporter periplasmic adaptor subunit [Thermodesulfobacteriota bacterium]